MKKRIFIKIKNALLILTLIATVLATSNLNTYAIVPPEDAMQTYQVETFTVVSKNTITGEVSSRECDTSITTTALNKGLATVSTPSYNGNLPYTDNIEITNSDTIPQHIIGDDNRQRISNPKNSFPYRAICRIISYWDENNDGVIDNTVSVGTGFLEGPSAVVTAGHCIYDAEKKMWCEYAEVIFAQDGPNSAPYGVMSSTTIHTSVAWTQSGDWNQDWAIVEIEEEIGYSTGWFGKLWTSGSLDNTQIRLTGYPGDIATSINDKNNNTVQHKGKYMWTCTGKITDSLSARLEYDADNTGGMSGGPVYNSGNQVLAINAYEVEYSSGSTTWRANGGTRITEWLYNLLEEFRP